VTQRAVPAAKTGTPHRSSAVRVLVIARLRLYREGLVRLLGEDERLDVLAGVGTRDEALAGVRTIRPEVVVLDLTRDDDGVRTVRELSSALPELRVVAVALSGAPEEVVRWAEAGIGGYVGVEASLGDLADAVVAASRDQLACDTSVAGALLLRVGALAAGHAQEEVSRLTRREGEILALLRDGLSNKEIAALLRIELSTVKNHVHNVLTKLGAARRGEAAARAARFDLRT
jgi:two-component system nitrate/nitrite response regulator NarL